MLHKDSMIKNCQKPEYITITTNELDLSLIIDYTELFKLSDINITKASVKITYSNIGKIISLS